MLSESFSNFRHPSKLLQTFYCVYFFDNLSSKYYPKFASLIVNLFRAAHFEIRFKLSKLRSFIL